jgi:hypothetical protein
MAKDLAHRVADLKLDPEFVAATTRFTADKDSTNSRLELATKALSE